MAWCDGIKDYPNDLRLVRYLITWKDFESEDNKTMLTEGLDKWRHKVNSKGKGKGRQESSDDQFDGDTDGGTGNEMDVSDD